MEPQLLFVVVDTFEIAQSKCALAPGISLMNDAVPVKIGHRIRLRKPDGTHVDTEVRGIEILGRYNGSTKLTAPILVPIKKSDAPAGTEVWLIP